MQHSESGILDGKIVGNRVSFTTKYEYTKQFGKYNFKTGQRAPDIRAEFVNHYDGEIREDGILFRKQTGDGYYDEIIARKIVDLTEITASKASPGKKNIYTLAYVLPGHEGGVQSLSFGPDQGRYRSGGLRLASGGSQDGAIKFWDIATSEPYGTDNLHATKNGGFVHLIYNSETRNGGVDLTVAGVSKDRHSISFLNRFFYQSGGVAGGGRTPEFSGVVGAVAISRNSLAIAEAETTANFTITVRYTDGDVKRTLNCEGAVRAIALSFDGKLLTSAETMKSKETILKLWDLSSGDLKWSTSSQTSINHLAFNLSSRKDVTMKWR